MGEFVKAEPVPSNIKFKRTVIDPILAQKWLDTRNLNNRSLRKARVRNDAEDMLAGRWYENGDVIRLAPDGELLDGQHRLHAIIRANCEIALWVAYNVPKEAMGSIDVGSSRSFSDYLRFNGEKNTNVQAAITRRLEGWSRGFRIHAAPGKETTSNIVLRDLYWQRADDIRNAARIGYDINYHTGFLRVTTAAFFYLLTSDIDLDAADDFKDSVLDPDRLSKNHPVVTLRRKLLTYDANNLTDAERLALFIHAWNFYRNDEPVETLYKVYTANGKASSFPLTNANFPEPK